MTDPHSPCRCGHDQELHQGTATKCVGIIVERGREIYCHCPQFTGEEQR
jgi:hypothetical protein